MTRFALLESAKGVDRVILLGSRDFVVDGAEMLKAARRTPAGVRVAEGFKLVPIETQND